MSYLDMDCKNCGRHRVEEDFICEKCGFDNKNMKFVSHSTNKEKQKMNGSEKKCRVLDFHDQSLATSMKEIKEKFGHYFDEIGDPNDFVTHLREDEDRVEELERVIQGMYPAWVAAMSYGEHGRAADLDRIRNYYNGCPMSTEDIELMLSVIPDGKSKRDE